MSEVINAGPSQEWIDTQKKKYGQIFKVVLSNDVYVYRCLKRSEFRELQKGLVPEMTQQGPIVPADQAFELEEKISKACVLWPEDFGKIDVPAGLPTILATYISESSGAQVDEAPTEL